MLTPLSATFFSHSDLSSNQLVSLQPGTFSKLTALKSLYLGLQQTEGPCTSQLNNFTTLPPSVFSSLSNVTELAMQCLPIQTLPADTFAPLTSVAGPYSSNWCVAASCPPAFASQARSGGAGCMRGRDLAPGASARQSAVHPALLV